MSSRAPKSARDPLRQYEGDPSPSSRLRMTDSCQSLHFLKPLHGAVAAGRTSAPSLETEFDELLDQSRVLDVRRFPQLRIHGDVREARNGIDLVDEEAVGAAFQEEVDARKS